MLWTRFFIHDGHISTSVHVDGPEPGDLVIVTAQAALRQIVDHRNVRKVLLDREWQS
jgi:hypothetical protein